MRPSAKLSLDDTIVYLRTLDENRLAVVDRANNFYIINLSTMEHAHKFSFKGANTHVEKQGISFSPDGNYLAYSEKEQSVVRVIDIQAQKLHHSFPTLHNQIETLCFDPTSNYLVAGSVTGRVYLWNLFSTGQVSRLSSFPEYTPHLFSQPKINYVSAACFSPRGELVATTGYGGSIVITNIHTEVSPKRITPNHVRINALSFIGEGFIAAGNIEGGIDLIDLHTHQIIKHFQTGLGSIKNIVASASGSYVLASGHTKHLALIDMKAKKIISPEYINLPSKIISLAITPGDNLIVGCEDGSLHFFELYPEEMLKMRLNTAAYYQAHELLYSYPLLRESPLVQELEDAWEETLSDAITRVEKREFDALERTLQRFARVPSKKDIIREFQNLSTHFERFKTAVNHENFALAYSMAEHVPLLKRTTPYAEMEAVWDATFLKAQTYIIKDQTHYLFKILEPFGRVNTKLCFIQVLLHQPELFLKFTQLINSHDYENIFDIANSYPCLKEIHSYKEIVQAADDLYEKSRQHIFSRDYELAELELNELAHIPYMKIKLAELRHLLALSKRLEDFYTEDNLNACYTLIDKNEELRPLSFVKELEKSWSEKMRAAEKEALLGHTKEIKRILADLLGLESRAQKVGSLLRLSFLTQIKLLIIKRQSHKLQEAIESYIEMFAYDTELHNLILKLKKENIATIELSPEQEHRRPRTLWLQLTNGKIPDTILQRRKETP